MEDGGREEEEMGGGCFTAAVSLLLRVRILMRSVNECWQRRGCAAAEKQPPCPCRTAGAAAPHSLFLFTPRFTRNMCASFFLSQIFLFLCISCSFISDVFSFLPSDTGDLFLWSFDSCTVLVCLGELLMLSSGVCFQQWLI